VILDARGIRVELPQGWSGRLFARGRAATLHAGDFTLALQDGEFGTASTAAMHPGAAFLALTEYEPGGGLKPHIGLFASRRLPLPLDPTSFSSNGLAHPRPGQQGMQHFFTSAGRPFCLYVVLAGGRSHRRRQLGTVNHVLRSVKIDQRR